jgi:hypothetical protein
MRTLEQNTSVPTTALPADIAPEDVNNIDAWFYRPPAPEAAAPQLPASLEDAHDALVTDYDRKRAAAEQRQARYVRRWWEQ